MTTQAEDAGARRAPVRVSWGRTVLRALIVVVGFVALVAFSAVLARLTLTPSQTSADIAGANLRPGHSLRQYAEDYTFLAACKQIGGNLVLGAPFGLILPVLVPRRLRMVRVVVLTGLVMVLVELAQGAIVEGRAFDVDDVILNTGGALIAYLLLGRRIGHRFHALAVPRAAVADADPDERADVDERVHADERADVDERVHADERADVDERAEGDRKPKAAPYWMKARVRPGAGWPAARTGVVDRFRRGRPRVRRRP
ncbi:VanZ family protein [Streptomyces sp. NBC_01142]|uniref:VanZ family protein n=1 Tax=Streptomyces sp. NBC_01142 TaxID=2975865 RepID=UPI002259A37B|nr:VanZ family protein [Streptomyces sp. NBC_01142]MCX4823939.1 VanZ family protein [Streptomyces sp. NBC_01142]